MARRPARRDGASARPLTLFRREGSYAAKYREPAAVTLRERRRERKVAVGCDHLERPGGAGREFHQRRYRITHRHKVARHHVSVREMNRAFQFVNRLLDFVPGDWPMIFADVDAHAPRFDPAAPPKPARLYQLDTVVTVDIDAIESAPPQQVPDRLQVRH